jgi:hypothetical protein
MDSYPDDWIQNSAMYDRLLSGVKPAHLLKIQNCIKTFYGIKLKSSNQVKYSEYPCVNDNNLEYAFWVNFNNGKMFNKYATLFIFYILLIFMIEVIY